MLNSWHITLRAEDPAGNRYRAYDIHIDRDLFALWNITISWGRIGVAGTRKTITVASLDEAWPPSQTDASAPVDGGAPHRLRLSLGVLPPA
jgi:hypothetical protein